MKSLRVVALGALLLLATSGPAAVADSGPTKRALVVHISDYPPSAGYSMLHTDVDAELINDALSRQGFKKANVHQLANDQATRAGIVAGIETLITEAQPGDIVVVHYSGHGHRITDDDGDEIDGYDEVLVPYGAPNSMNGGYDGSKHLRDDDLGALVTRLRAKVGPKGNVLLTIDACHSGSITRGADDGLAVRGQEAPLGEPRKGTKGLVADVGGGGGTFEGSESAAGLAPFVVISAARHDEQAKETRTPDPDRRAVGSLSLALDQALGATRGHETYRGLFEQIRTDMAISVPGQTPQIEGDIDTELFSGTAIEQTPYYRITEVGDAGTVKIDGGRLLEVNVGSKVQLHARGTADPKTATPIATGKVTRASETKAEVTLDAAPKNPAALADAWAFVTETAYGDVAVRVQVDPALGKPVAELLANIPSATVVDSGAEVLLVPGKAPGTIGLVATTGDTVGEPVAATDGVALGAAIKGYARSRYLRSLDLRDDAVRVELTLVPAEVEVDDLDGTCKTATPLPPERFQEGGGWSFHEGDWYLLKFENTGKQAAYVTVLDVMPDGGVAQFYPAPGRKGTDNLLLPGASYTATDVCLQVTPPYGTDVLKLFATRDRIDFEPIVTRDPYSAARSAGATNPLEILMDDAMIGTRGGAAALPAQIGSTSSVAIEIKPRP